MHCHDTACFISSAYYDLCGMHLVNHLQHITFLEQHQGKYMSLRFYFIDIYGHNVVNNLCLMYHASLLILVVGGGI
jgi:hypothetical protein